MLYLEPVWKTQTALCFDEDNLGPVGSVIGKDGSVYIVFSGKGTHPLTSTTLFLTDRTYDIVIGKLNTVGELLWLHVFSELATTSNDTDPILTIGDNDELYIAYVTRGSTPGNFNMRDVPSFCPEVCTSPGDEDIVVACIRTDAPSPYVSWIAQNGAFNSCNSEVKPSIAIDTINNLLYIAFESSGNILCNIQRGTTNVVVACLRTSGETLWADGFFNNTPGVHNRNPTVAATRDKRVYIAFETTVRGQENQIEVIQYITNLSPTGAYLGYQVVWKASNTAILTSFPLNPDFPAPTSCKSPSIATDMRGRAYVAFVTDGRMQGSTVTTAQHDLVVLCLSPDGERLWMNQGDMYNMPEYVYIDCFTPFLTLDSYGNLYCSLVTRYMGGYGILMFKLNITTGAPIWDYPTYDGENYNAYLLASNTGIRSVLSLAPTQFPRVEMSARTSMIVAGVLGTQLVTDPISPVPAHYVLVCGFLERSVAEHVGSFTYMAELAAGCENFSLMPPPPAEADPSALPPSAPLITSIVAGSGQATVFFTIEDDGGSPLTAIAYSMDEGESFHGFNPPQSTSPITFTGLSNGVTYNIQLRAITIYGTSSSTIFNVTPQASGPTPPGLPTVSVVSVGVGQAELSFENTIDGGSPITNMEYSLTNGITYIALSPPQTTSPFTITGLVRNVTYNGQLRAINAIGAGPAAPFTIPSGAPPITVGPTVKLLILGRDTTGDVSAIGPSIQSAKVILGRTGILTITHRSLNTYANDLSTFNVIFLYTPHVQIPMNRALIQQLDAYVNGGGHLIMAGFSWSTNDLRTANTGTGGPDFSYANSSTFNYNGSNNTVTNFTGASPFPVPLDFLVSHPITTGLSSALAFPTSSSRDFGFLKNPNTGSTAIAGFNASSILAMSVKVRGSARLVGLNMPIVDQWGVLTYASCPRLYEYICNSIYWCVGGI